MATFPILNKTDLHKLAPIVYSPTQPNHYAQNQKSNSKASHGQVTDLGLKAYTRWYESM